MFAYYFLKVLSKIICCLPYKCVVNLGFGLGRIYYLVAKRQRIRAEETIMECLDYSEEEARDTIKNTFYKLSATFMEVLYLPRLNKNNIRGLVSIDKPEAVWELLQKGKGGVILTCHMDNWEWLGAALSLNGFPISAVEKPQPNRRVSQFMNELRTGVGQEIFSRGTNEILGCARAMKKGRLLGLIADQDGGYRGIFVPFFKKMAATPTGPIYFARKFKAPIISIFIERRESGYGHNVKVQPPIYYEDTGDREADDYNTLLKVNQVIEEAIRANPDNWLWFQHRWNTPYPLTEKEQKDGKK